MRARLVVISMTCFCAAQGASISGVVTDARTHLPLQGVAINANDAIVRTDIQGRYSLSLSPAAVVHLAATRTGYFAEAAILAGETIERNFELRPLMKISGVVEDYDTGERIAGCHVFAIQRIYALGRAWHVPAGLITADTRYGSFEIRNLEPGNYVLEIVPEETAAITAPEAKAEPSKKFHGWSYYPDASRIEMAAPITVTEAGDVPITIRLRRREPRAISGTVTAPASLELLRYVDDEPRVVASGNLSAAGAFRISGLPEGEYILTAQGDGGTAGTIPITVGDRDVTDVRVAPGSGQIVTGTPILPFRATASEQRVGVTNGRFEIATAPEGYAAVAGPAPRLDYTIAKTGSLKGKVKDSEYILLPGGTTLLGEFAIDLAPGRYQIAKLEGDEAKLIRNKEFLQAKAASESTTIEIKACETTAFQP